MSISEQVKHLKKLSDTARANVYSFEALSQSLREAADTIEALSAKLQSANDELNRWHTGHINEKIKNPFAYTSTLICHNCDHKDEYIEELEAEIEELKVANMENGGGWIACEDRLPELNRFYAVTVFDGEDYRVEPTYYAKIGYLGIRELKPNWWTDCTSNAEMIEDGEDKVIAWQPLPEPYRP